jgi:hypothetical protein
MGTGNDVNVVATGSQMFCNAIKMLGNPTAEIGFCNKFSRKNNNIKLLSGHANAQYGLL